jgi:hypothetical protein
MVFWLPNPLMIQVEKILALHIWQIKNKKSSIKKQFRSHCAQTTSVVNGFFFFDKP